jgi:probable HAF family extracellular repeat protein
VGSSGTCDNTAIGGLAVGPHAVLWDNGVPIDLGNLGGSMTNTAAAINDLGQVVGGADLASETPGFPGVQIHGFLWTSAAGMKDIGTVGTDFSSVPTDINNRGQVTGASCDDQGNCRAFLWENGVMTDLNDLVPADSPLYLAFAYSMNEAGHIAGMAIVTSTGEAHAFLATPEPTAAATAKIAPATARVTKPVPIPESARKLMHRRLALRGW